MKTVFMVAEKPILAQSISKILSKGTARMQKSRGGACPLFEFTGSFLNQQVLFRMTSTCGHVMCLDFPNEFNNWDKVDPAKLYFLPVVKKEAVPKMHMRKHLASQCAGAHYLVLWLDCDKEGENICFEVIDAVMPSMTSSASSEQNIFRAHFSAISDADISKAMRSLGKPNKSEALSVDARQELDLRIGCSFTRFQTKFFHGRYGDVDSKLISYGPCQTPTLGFCVNRQDEIENFKPKPYWTLHVLLRAANGLEVKPSWSRVRVFDMQVARLFLNRVKNCDAAIVESVTSEEKYRGKPLALNTVELLRVASARLGMGPQHAMAIAEQLYTQGFISYPRTETTKYPESFDFNTPIKSLQSHPSYGAFVNEILAAGIKKPRKGVDVGDHPPIVPVTGDPQQALSGDAQRLYDYIVRHFLSTISDDCKYMVTKVKFKVGSEEFTLTGTVVVKPGFSAILSSGSREEQLVPKFDVGQVLEVREAKLVDALTVPPDYLTESELITLMEKHGIGTDASIPVHINNICLRNYVTVRGASRCLVPTRLGIALVHGYQQIDPELVHPTMRAAVEAQLNLIAKGQAHYDSVTQHALNVFLAKFQYFVRNISLMDDLFATDFTSLVDSGKPFSRCGICRRYMSLISTQPMRLYCDRCRQTYNVPSGTKNSVIRICTEKKCPLDDFDLLYFQRDPNARGFSFCPYCFTNPPFPDMQPGQGCNKCVHPDCPNAAKKWKVGLCFICEVSDSQQAGDLTLDPFSSPKWKVYCTKCNCAFCVFDGAQKVQLTEEKCTSCTAYLLNVAFKQGKSPFGSKNEHKGCMFCDNILEPLVQYPKQSPSGRTISSGNEAFCSHRRGRGRGRGSGGRRRGSGRRGHGSPELKQERSSVRNLGSFVSLDL